MSEEVDPIRLRAALAEANIPTLACVLVQLTGDRRWIAGRYVPSRTRGLDDNDTGGLPPDVQDEIRDAAARAFAAWFAGRPPALPDPPDALLVEMMGVSLGETIPADYAPMIRQELRPPRADAFASEGVRAQPPPGTRALIIGAGISGLCAAVAFDAIGLPYTIVERKRVVGGVWSENRYPGAACDVPSHLYSFSFAPHAWSRYFADCREIHGYLEGVADMHDIRRHIRFGVEVVEARWDERRGEWDVDIVAETGGYETLRANIVVSGVGAFNKPRVPKLPGMADFAGPSVHTAQYPDAGIDLRGKRVVLVGNGASAMQVGPAVAEVAAALTVIQRTPQWVAPFPKFKQAVPAAVRWLLDAMPLYRNWYRLRLSWAFNDKLYEALQRDPEWANDGGSINAINEGHRKGLIAYMRRELGAAVDRLDELTPRYPPFGKRMLLDNGWYRMLGRPGVRLVTGAVTEVRPHGVVTRDGVEHAADVIIWATGFDVVNFLAPMRVVGRDGRELHDEWDGDDARAYLGTAVPGFPNFFCLYGPNTQFGHGGSLITVLERQMHYVAALLGRMFADGIETVEVRREVYEAHNREIDAAHDRMVWTLPGVETYCRNSKGRVVVNNPFRMLDVWRMTEEPDLRDYVTMREAEPA